MWTRLFYSLRLQWRLSLAEEEWWSSPESCIEQEVLSPSFLLGGYLWYVFDGLLYATLAS